MENQNLPEKAVSKLPKLQDLYSNFKKVGDADKLMVVLNSQPRQDWVKEHPFVKGHKYLPIDKIEFLLKKIFKTNYKIEVVKTAQLFNSIEVTVRVHYKDILTEEWLFHDGVGACEIQTEKGTGALKMDMSNVNRGAVSMALPIAKSLAIKDACDHFGRLFGSDLNRKDLLPITVDETIVQAEKWHLLREQFDKLSGSVAATEFQNIDRIISNKEETSYTKVKSYLDGVERMKNSKIITNE